MGALWKIALRNTARHRRRTVITAAVMTVGIASFILFDSVIAGMDRMTIDNMEKYTVSSIKVRNPAYVDDIAATPLDKGLSDADRAMAALAGLGVPATRRLRFVAAVSDYEDQTPLIADAVDPAGDGRVFGIGESAAEGSWLSPGDRKTAVIGAGLAEEMGIGVGDYVLVSAQTVDDVTNADEYRIIGLVSTPSMEINRSGLFISLEDAWELLGARGLVTEVDAALPRASSLGAAVAQGDAVAARLRSALPGDRVDPISVLAKDYLGLRNFKAKNTYVIIFIVLLIAAVGIVNTILMSVYSRIREIGVLRAYGMTRKDISRLFLLEGLSIGLIGSTAGLVVGILSNALMVAKGYDLTPFAAGMGSLPLTGVLRGEWNPSTIAFGFIFGIIVALVSAQIPARKAAKLEPTDALRFQ
jgi:ABC-type lipoprotein release transport system permease subunit